MVDQYGVGRERINQTHDGVPIMTIRIEPGLWKSAVTTALNLHATRGLAGQRAPVCGTTRYAAARSIARAGSITSWRRGSERDMGARVTVARGRTQSAPPASIDLLLDLERLIYRLRDRD